MKHTFIFIAIILSAVAVQAQDYRLDLNIRANTMFLIEDGDDPNSRIFSDFPVGFSAEVLFFPKSFIGVGAFYSKSVVPGAFEYEQYNYYNYSEYTTDYDYAMYGLSLQLTTSRKRAFRAYVVGRAGKFEFVEDAGPFTIGDSKFSYSGGVGMMIKLSRKLNFNLFEANYAFLPKEFSMENDAEIGGLYIQSGLSLKLLQKK